MVSFLLQLSASCAVWRCVHVWVCWTQPVSQGLINYTNLRGAGVDICSLLVWEHALCACVCVSFVSVLKCVHAYVGLKKLFQLQHADAARNCLCACVKLCACARVCVRVEQEIQVERQRGPPECSGGILAQAGHQMSEQSRNLLSRPVTLFFLFLLALRSGSGTSRNKFSKGSTDPALMHH